MLPFVYFFCIIGTPGDKETQLFFDLCSYTEFRLTPQQYIHPTILSFHDNYPDKISYFIVVVKKIQQCFIW